MFGDRRLIEVRLARLAVAALAVLLKFDDQGAADVGRTAGDREDVAQGSSNSCKMSFIERDLLSLSGNRQECPFFWC